MTKKLVLAAILENNDDPEQVTCWYQVGSRIFQCHLQELPEGTLKFCLAISPAFSYQQVGPSGDLEVKAIPRGSLNLDRQG